MMIGKWGQLLDVPAPARPFQVASSRPRQVTVALSGRRYSTAGPVRRRTWRWDVRGLDNAGLAALERLEQLAATGPVYWLDPTTFDTNMLPPEVASPTAGLSDLDAPGLTLTVDGLTHDAVAGQLAHDVPTVQGESYRVRVAAGAHGDVIDLVSVVVESLDAAGAVIATVASATQAAAGTAEQLSVSWTAGVEAGVRVTLSGGAWGAAQMVVQARDPGVWRAGRGVPLVDVDGLDADLLWTLDDGETRWSAASVTLLEVDS